MLGELDSDYSHQVFYLAGFSALSSYINAFVSSLSDAKKVAIDAIHGTDRVGMKLRCVLAELNGVDIPFGYLLI